ncbi:MAG: hypothetical protein ACYDCQ_13430 [Dehalococcoidia bacterium]
MELSLESPFAFSAERRPRTGGRMDGEQRRSRLEIWADFINEELEARNMRPAQLALYANVNASTVSVWRHRKSLPDREAVSGVARCFRLPVELVAEKAGMLPAQPRRSVGRIDTDAEWRALLADIDRLPVEQFSGIKAALRLALGARRIRRAG